MTGPVPPIPAPLFISPSGLLRIVSWAWSSSSPFPLRDAAVLSWVGSQSVFRPVCSTWGPCLRRCFPRRAHLRRQSRTRGGKHLERCAQRSLSLRDGRHLTRILELERCHSDLGDAPRRNDAGPHSADVDVVYVGSESAVGARWTTRTPCAPPFRLDQRFCPVVCSAVVIHSFEFHGRSDFLAVIGSTPLQLILRLCVLTLVFAPFLSFFMFLQLFRSPACTTAPSQLAVVIGA